MDFAFINFAPEGSSAASKLTRKTRRARPPRVYLLPGTNLNLLCVLVPYQSGKWLQTLSEPIQPRELLQTLSIRGTRMRNIIRVAGILIKTCMLDDSSSVMFPFCNINIFSTFQSMHANFRDVYPRQERFRSTQSSGTRPDQRPFFMRYPTEKTM